MVTQLIREAREHKGNLSVWWLDLAKAYSSIPQTLLQLNSVYRSNGRGDGTYKQFLILMKNISAVRWSGASGPTHYQTITFIRAIEQAFTSARTSASILASTRDWKLLVDLEQQVKFPWHIAISNFWPDMPHVSEFTRQVIMMELTVPWEGH